MTWMTIVPLGMTIILGIISQFPLNERVSNSKQIQFMAGVSPFLYWTINFLFDLLIYFLITALMLVTIAIYDQGENFSSYEYGKKKKINKIYILFLKFRFILQKHYL